MTPAKAIETADREGFCKLNQHTFLWKTCEATAYIQLECCHTPYILVTDPHGWKEPIKVASERNKKLIEVCEKINNPPIQVI